MSFLSKLGGKNILVGLERKQWTPPIFSYKITPTKYSKKKKKNHFLSAFSPPFPYPLKSTQPNKLLGS